MEDDDEINDEAMNYYSMYYVLVIDINNDVKKQSIAAIGR